jgi:threonine dehydratase
VTGSPFTHEAVAATEPVDAPAGGIAADSLAPRRVGQLVLRVVAEPRPPRRSPPW